MPRTILKPNEKNHHNDFSFIPLSPSLHKDEDAFLKACQNKLSPGTRRHTIEDEDTFLKAIRNKLSPGTRRHTISCSTAPSLLNELLSSLMVPFRMTNVDEEGATREGRHADDHVEERPPLNAVSFDDARDRSASHLHKDVASGTDPTLPLDEKSSAFSSVSTSYEKPYVHQQEVYQGREDIAVRDMAAPPSAQDVSSNTRGAEDVSDLTQYKRGSPRQRGKRSHQAGTSNPYPLPYYGYQQRQQPPPYPYDYSGYYHQHLEGGKSNPAFRSWPNQSYDNYSHPFQEYSHSYYSTNPHHHMPSQSPVYHHPSSMYEDPYFNMSRHPHSAPPSYHRGYARTTPPIGFSHEAAKHPQQYKETPSAITEGTTPSKQSPPLELSPASFGYSGNEDERKPAAMPAARTQGEAQVSNQGTRQHHDDFEPIPIWNEGPPVIAELQYREYPAWASQEYGGYAVDPTMVGLPPRQYSPTPIQSSAAAAAGGTSQLSSVLLTGGEGSSWEKRFAELIDFRTKHGHCEVPQNYKENTSLGIWVNKQRMEHKLRIEGKNSSLNDARLQRLESVGFRWAKRKGQASWNEKVSHLESSFVAISFIFLTQTSITLGSQFEELKAYKKKHGNVS